MDCRDLLEWPPLLKASLFPLDLRPADGSGAALVFPLDAVWGAVVPWAMTAAVPPPPPVWVS